ncbi:MAG: PstS family phosphate ABC transporter substrate-binding protein [Dehalococcoidia bacterium]
MKKTIKKWLIPLVVVLVLAVVLVRVFAGGGSPSSSIKIIGSNTVTPLSSVWAEEFMKDNPQVSIAVSGPGSGVGIAALIDGTTDICQSSRAIKQSEIDQAEARGVHPYEIQLASDGLSVVVHPSNPVSELTIAQLSAIYTNQITNWREVGGNDAPIVVLSRDTNSGTHVFFKEHVVQMLGLPTQDTTLEYGSSVLFVPSTEEGVMEVAGNPNAIFYAGLGYVTDAVKLLAIKKTASDPGVLPSVPTVLDGTYPISRPLFFYTNGAPAGTIKDFIDYCLSPKGQSKVTEVGYIPLQ